MRYLIRVRPKVFQLWSLAVLLPLLAVACGATANPATSAPATVPAQPRATAAVSTAAPTSSPTSVAQPPGASAVNPGKVTWMVGSFANERMHYCLAAGGGHDYGRPLNAFLIASDIKDGARVLVPGVATNWKVSPDGRTWTVTIRKGVLFHDGKPVTAEDVLWNLRFAAGVQAKEYATGGGCLTTSQLTEKFEQTGPDQVSVTFKDPYPIFPEYFSDASGTWIGTVHPAGLTGKRDTLHDEAAEAAYDKNPVGAGAFKLVKHVVAESMQMERFEDHYYQPKNGLPKDLRPRFKTFDLRLIPEVATRVAALRAGEADIAPINLGGLKQVEAGGGRAVFGQEGTYFFARLLGCWKEQLPCHDKRVRQALNYAIDRQVMRDKLYGGPEVMQVKGFTQITASTFGYSPDLDPFPFDPNKARQLLTDAGYAGGKGFGKLIINTWQSSALPLMPDAAQLVAASWKQELGIEAEVKIGEEAAIKKLTRLTEDAYGQVLFRDNETRLDGSDMLNSTYGRNPDRPDSASRDPEITELAQKTRVIMDPVAREKALIQTYRRLREESYEISFGYFNIPWGVGPRIQTWQPYPLAFYPSALHTITLK